MNLHPAEKRTLGEGEEIREAWPSHWPDSPLQILTTREFRGIGIWGAFLSWGAKSLQLFWPGFFRLILHRGFTLILYDDLYFVLGPEGCLCGFLKPKKTWRRVSPYV